MSRIDTASRAPLGTAMKPIPTGFRQPTGFKGGMEFNKGVGMSANIKVVERPVTHQGVPGLKNVAQAHTRQIYDRSYYITALTKKNKEIVVETNKFRKEIEDLSRDNQYFLQYEKRYEELNKEVRNFEGKLADYNLAADKIRGNTRPEDIRAIYEHIKTQNAKQLANLDAICVERMTQEEQIAAIETQLNEINQQAELKINELDIEQKNEYEALMDENKKLLLQINVLRNELDQVNTGYLQAENKLRLDTNKLKAQELKQSITYLENKKNDLEIQLNEQNLSFPEARDRLLARIKEDNNFMQQTDKRIKEIKKIIENYEKKVKELQVDLEEKKGEEQDKQKYEILYQRDKEITEFIDSFETTRKNEMEHLYQLEHNILELLELGSKSIGQTSVLPSAEKFKAIQEEYEAKKDLTDNAESTLKRLQLEFEQRSSELKKLEQAEERIGPEMKNLNEKMLKMKEEIETKFNNVHNMKSEAEERKVRMIEEKEQLKNFKLKVVEEIKSSAYERDIKEKKLHLHEQYSLYADFEKRMSQNQQQIYQLKSYINTKSKDMNYQGVQKDCLGLMEELNVVVQKQMSI